jgi:hypothetical protein
MKLPPKITIVDHFKDLEDTRVERTKRHKLIDIVPLFLPFPAPNHPNTSKTAAKKFAQCNLIP